MGIFRWLLAAGGTETEYNGPLAERTSEDLAAMEGSRRR